MILKALNMKRKVLVKLQLGSLEFKKGQPALISTNPVDFECVLCRVE